MKPALLAFLLTAAAVAAQDARPLGLGIATPLELSAERPLYLYGASDGHPATATPLDSLTFRKGAHHFEVAAAPPWLDPETVKLDYDTITFRAVSLTNSWVEVVVHDQNLRWPPRTLWLARDAVAFRSWAEVLLDVHSVETARAAPLHAGPGTETPRLGATASGRPLHVLRVLQSWVQVVDADAGEGAPRGWIRWHDGEHLLVTINLLS